jgi:hypothetical protein
MLSASASSSSSSRGGSAKVSILIELSEADEDPTQALQTVAKVCGPQLVTDVHLVQWAYNSDNPKWRAGLEALRVAQIPWFVHSTLDEAALRKLQSKALVRLDPAHYVTDGALRMLIEQMAGRSSWFSGADHFAISSYIWIEPAATGAGLRDWCNAFFAYGWLLVVLVLDTFRFYTHLGAYHRNTDVTARLVSTTFPDRTVLAPHRWWMLWGGFGSGLALPQSGGNACLLLPSAAAGDQGMSLLMRLLRGHRHLGAGLWLLPFTLYYCAFAFPWWMLMLPRSYIPFWWMAMPLDPRQWAWWWQMLQLGHLLVVAMTSYNQLHVPWGMQPMQILLYPFYLATAPLVFLYARLARYHGMAASITK